MNLEEFKRDILIIEKSKAEDLRNRYITKFIDTENEYYKENILALQKCSDGLCYSGYLWDCIKYPKVIDFSYITEKANIKREVFVFWDIHSKDKIFIKDYWNFGKDNMLQLDFKHLINNLIFFPEDIYIFESNVEWTIVLTHEHTEEARWCLKSGNI